MLNTRNVTTAIAIAAFCRFAVIIARPRVRTTNVFPTLISSSQSEGNYIGWRHSASLFILTTPDGADLPATASENNFPLLVRLNRDSFDFTQAKPHGEDIRFATIDGAPLKYQIEEWDSTAGRAAIWVRIPHILGNAKQEIKILWGKPNVESTSDGAGVFNVSNGYISVLHMTDPVLDELGNIHAKNVSTTAFEGVVGKARHFAGGQGIAGGEDLTAYPASGDAHSTEAWFRVEKPNVTMIGWGNEGGGRGSKVRMLFQSPPHIHIDSDFSDVKSRSMLPMAEWIHVVHTYQNGVGRIYINGKLDGEAHPTLNIKRPSKMWVGGWYGNYDFVGDIDEVRVSSVARSADWVKLEYENQKPMQTLVGAPVQPGNRFSVLTEPITVLEGKSVTLSADLLGAQKVYWSLKRNAVETVVAVDTPHYVFNAGRVVGDATAAIRIKALYSDGERVRDIPILIKEAIPEPRFTLQVPKRWDGRHPLKIVPIFSNLAQMQKSGAGDVAYKWTVDGVATICAAASGTLLLTRSQGSGVMTVTLSADNGGAPTVVRAKIEVKEPASDAWIVRRPANDEKPVDNQFYPRDDKNRGTLFYNGNLSAEKYDAATQNADSVFLKLYDADSNNLLETARHRLQPDRRYALAVKLNAGLIRYRAEFGMHIGGKDMVLRIVTNLVCGDAYIIDGQSNAEATAWGDAPFTYTSDWIRSYGSTEGGEGARLKLWGNAVARSPGGKLQAGYWGLELARRLLEQEKMPICILNGAVGGTRIDQHQRNDSNPEDVSTIYGRLLWRVKQAGLTHGIRAILWHQGENDQGADGPTGGFGWETYRRYFVDMSAAWKQDYPNIQHYYLFQIWPKSCAMGIDGSDNRLREVQRSLPLLYSHMSIMSTLGVKPPGGCHYPPAGYAEIARLITPLVERDIYGNTFAQNVNAPNLKRVYFSDPKRERLVLEFDQPVVWDPRLSNQFYMDGTRTQIISGSTAGNMLLLTLAAPSVAHTITYLDSASWSENNLLYGKNGIAALTFCEVPIETSHR